MRSGVRLSGWRIGNQIQGAGTRRSIMLKTNVNHMMGQLRCVNSIHLF
jgi:hypothetical protein